MIQGIGIDSVTISRFNAWDTYSDTKLLRIFHADEITYCKQSPLLAPQRFAVRFAAREAFFKAYCSAFPHNYIPFLTHCKTIYITRNKHNIPEVSINWALLKLPANSFTILISLTHTETTATAIVYLQKFSV